MDLTRVEWQGGMSCGRSSGGATVGDPSSKWGSSSSTCSSFTCPEEASKISRGWIEKPKGGSRVFVEETWDSSGKISKTEEVVKEEWH